jgi:hypothetical protein
VQNEYGQLRRNITSAPGFILYGAPRLFPRVIVVKKWRRQIDGWGASLEPVYKRARRREPKDVSGPELGESGDAFETSWKSQTARPVP